MMKKIYIIIFISLLLLAGITYKIAHGDHYLKIGIAVKDDRCIPVDKKIEIIDSEDYYKVWKISQWGYVATNNDRWMLFDSNESEAKLVVMVQILENGHPVVWTRMDCDSV